MHPHTQSSFLLRQNGERERECATELFENCENQFKVRAKCLRFISDFNLLGQLQHHFSSKKKVYELRKYISHFFVGNLKR